MTASVVESVSVFRPVTAQVACAHCSYAQSEAAAYGGPLLVRHSAAVAMIRPGAPAGNVALCVAHAHAPGWRQ